MKYMYWILVLAIIWFWGWWTLANSRNLSGVTIITRQQRGADETRRYANHPRFVAMRKANEENRQRLQELKITNPAKWQEEIQASIENQLANDYMLINHAQKIAVDNVISTHNGNNLHRAQSYKNNKIQIVVHHTVNDYTELKSTGDVENLLRGIYEFHTLTRWRGDIWYNFLIGPFGEIYEGRAWWEWVVWAHAAYNNVPSVGIALIGNFEIQNPTDAQMRSLINLSTALAKKYGINPQAQTIYHRRLTVAPYMQDVKGYALGWHKDMGATSCPWKNLYERLDRVRNEVAKQLNETVLISTPAIESTLPTIQQHISRTFSSSQDTMDITITQAWLGNNLTCQTNDLALEIVWCKQNNNTITITIRRKQFASGRRTFFIQWSQQNLSVSVLLLWLQDLPIILNERKNAFARQQNITLKTPTITKIQRPIKTSEINQLSQLPVKVLLYDVSLLTGWTVQCDGGCLIEHDGQRSESNAVTITTSGNKLFINNIPAQTITIWSKKNLTILTNFVRKSYVGIDLNSFHGTLTRTVTQFPLMSWWFTNRIGIINQLSLNDYLKGIVETNDQEHQTKNDIMAILAKQYILYYIDGQNIHPNIPLTGSLYNAIDHPDFFQKYSGAGVQKVLTKRFRALENTKNMYITYNDTLPLLPYFSCSAWFTRSASEKRWRQDTPRLQSSLDFAPCQQFNGHGVGLSWRWAQEMAKRNISLNQIIQRYYPGTTVNVIR